MSQPALQRRVSLRNDTAIEKPKDNNKKISNLINILYFNKTY